MTQSLVADVGGTNTRVARAEGRAVLPDTVRRFRNAEHPGLGSVLRAYMGEVPGPVSAAAVAVAGPVRDGVGMLTNLDWTIDRPGLARETGAGITAILNDLQAQGHALGAIAPGCIHEVVGGPEGGPRSAKLVINVGTGFNASAVHDAEAGRLVTPSECGHANLPIRNEAELRLCRWVEGAHGFPAIEDVLSGRGLERVHAWVGHENGEPGELGAADIMAALARGDQHARRTARVFVKVLGTVCGNLSLVHLPFGGVFLVGGVARAFRPHLAEFGFAEAFRDKGRFAGFMRNFRVCLIEDDDAALTGLASHLLGLARGGSQRAPTEGSRVA